MRRYRRHASLPGEQILLLNKMESELTLRGYARRTQKSYGANFKTVYYK